MKMLGITIAFIVLALGVFLYVAPAGNTSTAFIPEDMYLDVKKISSPNEDVSVKPVDTEGIINQKNVDQKKIMTATLSTNQGDITIEFFASDAPNTVANFIKLAGEGFYNGTKFHRVIKDFMIQGGDPLSKDDTQIARWGTGGPGYSFADEIRDNNKNIFGTIAMANSGPNTNGSQFFINAANNNFLDSKHTVFGRVISGMDVVQKIENTKTAPGDRPLTQVVVKNVLLK